MNLSKFIFCFMLLILALGQYATVTPASSSANYDVVEPAGLVEYRETLMLTDATELIAALSRTFALSLTETQVASLSEKLERLYMQLFPDGVFCDLELFLLKVNDELSLNLSVDDIRMFEKLFWSEVERAKEQLKNGAAHDVLLPPHLISMPVREESAPYLHGRSLIAVILVDDASMRVGWNWISKTILRSEIGAAMGYLEAKAPKEAGASFSARIYHTSVSSIIDPLNELRNPGVWMDEAVRNLGYSDVHDMARKLRSESGAENVILVFVPHKPGLVIGGYALPAPYNGYGERATVFFFLVDLFGIGIPTSFSVYVHEILHLYGALDEYPWGPPDDWATASPYPPLYELWPKPNLGWPLIVCVMDDPLLYWFAICTQTRGQIGWNDYDGDGILDPVDPDPRNYRPWEYVFNIAAHGYHEVEVGMNMTGVMVIGDFAPLVWTLTYPQPYVNFYVFDPNGNAIIQAFEVVNYSFSFNVPTAGIYRFRFENPTDTPIYYMRLRLALIATLPVVVELEPRAFSLNLTILDQNGRALSGIPVSIVSSTANYSALLMTDPDGKLNLWLPEGSYAIKATYMNSTILDTNINVSSNVSKTYVISEFPRPSKATQLTLSPETFTIAPGQSITITAKLTSDGQPLAGRQIVFAASLGSVSSNTVTTNERGEASVVYTAPVMSVRTSVTITASFLGDSTHEGSTATCQGVVEVEVGLPTVSISGASFAVPETLKDEASSYRASIPEDVLKLLPIGLPSESFVLATPEGLYLVFANKSESGLAYVEGWRLPQSIGLKGISLSVVVAKCVAFEKEGAPTTIGEILASPGDYKFKLVKVSTNRRQISILYDPDEEPHVEFPMTIGCLVEKPIKPLNVVKAILEKAKDFALKPDEQLVEDLLQVEGEECLWLFNFNYEYWYDVPAVTNGIVIPTDHPIFELIERSLPVVERFTRLGGKVILYDVKTDIPYEAVSSVRELVMNYDKYVGKVMRLAANCYGGYISVQEVIEENTPCGRDKVYVQNIGCVDVVVDVRLEGLIAWNKVSVPPRREELLLVLGVSSYHQDEQFVRTDGVFELVGKVISTRQISDSLPEGIAFLLCRAKKIGEIHFEKMAQQVKDEVRDRVGELYWVLQNIYPYTGRPHIPFKVPRTVFNPVAPIFVRTPEEIPEIRVERNFTISIAVATPEAPMRLSIANSHITDISIALKEVVKNATICFEKLFERSLNVPKPPGLVYAYYEISVNISKEALKGANITFWVLKEWLVANKAAAKDVTMLRYSAEKWEELPTRLVGENSTHFKFVAETSGFSVFAITVKAVTPTTGVEGYARDEAGRPMKGVAVIALSKIALGKVSETDETGYYLVEVPPGDYVFVFSATGYVDRSVDVSLRSGELKRVDVTLKQAKAEFFETWYDAKFEVALATKEPWKVGSEVGVEVWITVSDMGGNRQLEFRKLKLELLPTSVEETVPLNVKTEVGGTVCNSSVALKILDDFRLMKPGFEGSYTLSLTLEGSVTDRLGIAWPGLAMESTRVGVYAPPSPVSLSTEMPAKVTVGDEFEVKVKVRNDGEYLVRDVKVELLLPFGTSALGPLDWSKSALGPGEEAVATFRLKANIKGTPSVSASLSYTTLWGYEVFELGKVLGSLTIEEKKACIIATAAYCSELDPHVQFLRGFRDNFVLKTFAGSNFMEIFNAWYYSFSPSAASFISTSELLRSATRVALYPLIGILHLGVLASDAFSFNSEVSVMVAGMVISAMIGLVYFTPPTLLALYLVGRRRGVSGISRLKPKALLMLLAVSALSVVIAELTLSPTLMMIGSGALVLSTMVLVTWTVALKATRRLLAHPFLPV